LDLVNRWLYSLARHKLVAIACVVGAVALACVPLLRPSQTYQSSSQVALDNNNLGIMLAGVQDPPPHDVQELDRIAGTAMTMARNPSVIAATARALGVAPSAVKASTSVEQVPNTDLLLFHGSASDGHRAEILSSTYAQSFVAFLERWHDGWLVSAQRRIAMQLAAAPVGSPERAQLAIRLAQVKSVESLASAPASVTQSATSATRPRTNTVRQIGAAALLGLAIASGAAALMESRVRRLHSGRDAARMIGTRYLGSLPGGVGRRRRRSRVKERAARRTLRACAEAAGVGGRHRSVLVCPADGRAPAVDVCHQLARAYAEGGRRVAAVDLSPAGALQRAVGKRRRDPGLTDVLAGTRSIDDVLLEIVPGRSGTLTPERLSDREAYSVVPSGTPGAMPVAGLKELMRELASGFDLVLCVCESLLEAEQPYEVLALVDAIIVTYAHGLTTVDALLGSSAVASMSNAHLVGVVGVGGVSEVGDGAVDVTRGGRAFDQLIGSTMAVNGVETRR
jgi:Mrp family chromosome partitioning ATPase